MSRHPLIK